MKVKEYLQRLQRLDTVINQKIKEIDTLRTTSTSVGSIDYSRERVQTSSDNNALYVKAISRIYDLEEEINKEIDQFVDEKHKIISQIHCLENSKYIEILYKHYVEFKKLEEISVELNYSYQYVRKLHGYALHSFARKYPELFSDGDRLQNDIR